MEVIRDLIPYELKGSVDLTFDDEGLRCRLDIPAEWLSGSPAHGMFNGTALPHQGIACDLIDLRTVRPIDWPMIEASVRRTGRLLALDTGYLTGGIAGEIVARVAETCWRICARRLGVSPCPMCLRQRALP